MPGTQNRKLILASASPRRYTLLEQLGLKAQVVPADIDETVLIDEQASGYVLRLSEGKARKVATQMGPDAVVVGADTTIDFCGQILGKPVDLQQCLEMLGALGGQTHQVITGVTVVFHGARFVKHLSGSYSNVVGLPLYETSEMLQRVQVGSPCVGNQCVGSKGKGKK